MARCLQNDNASLRTTNYAVTNLLCDWRTVASNDTFDCRMGFERDTTLEKGRKQMKRDTLKKFEELEKVVAKETSEIANELLTENETYEQAIADLNDYYESNYNLDDYVYSEIFKKMTMQVTHE